MKAPPIDCYEFLVSKTALCIACENGDLVMAEELLHRGAAIELHTGQNGEGVTMASALVCASSSGLIDLVKSFIKRGADLEGVVCILYGGEDAYSPDKALQMASRGGHLETVRLLLDSGADVDGDEWTEHSGLCWAAANGHTEIVKLLLGSGASWYVLDEARKMSHLPIKRKIVQMLEDASEANTY